MSRLRRKPLQLHEVQCLGQSFVIQHLCSGTWVSEAHACGRETMLGMTMHWKVRIKQST